MTEASPERRQRESLERSMPFRSYFALGLGIIVGVAWFAADLAGYSWRQRRQPLDKHTRDYLVLGDYR